MTTVDELALRSNFVVGFKTDPATFRKQQVGKREARRQKLRSIFCFCFFTCNVKVSSRSQCLFLVHRVVIGMNINISKEAAKKNQARTYLANLDQRDS